MHAWMFTPHSPHSRPRPFRRIFFLSDTYNTMTMPVIPKRRVKFQSVSKVHVIPQSDNDVWLSQRDLVEFRKDIIRSLRRYKNQGVGEDDKFCLRGMESLLNNGLSAGRRRLARRAVIQAQSMKDPEFVARIYRNYCNSSLEAARVNGTKDQQAALLILQNEGSVV